MVKPKITKTWYDTVNGFDLVMTEEGSNLPSIYIGKYPNSLHLRGSRLEIAQQLRDIATWVETREE